VFAHNWHCVKNPPIHFTNNIVIKLLITSGIIMKLWIVRLYCTFDTNEILGGLGTTTQDGQGIDTRWLQHKAQHKQRPLGLLRLGSNDNLHWLAFKRMSVNIQRITFCTLLAPFKGMPLKFITVVPMSTNRDLHTSLSKNS